MQGVFLQNFQSSVHFKKGFARSVDAVCNSIKLLSELYRCTRMEDITNSIRSSSNEYGEKKDCLDKIHVKKNCIHLINVFARGSSIHALSQVEKTNTKVGKAFWFLILILCISCCIYQVNNFLLIYFRYPVLIDVEVKNNKVLDFPAVTICNLNRMKRSHIEYVDRKRHANAPWPTPRPSTTLRTTPRTTTRMLPRSTTIPLSERKKYTSVTKATISFPWMSKEWKYKSKSKEFFSHYMNINAFRRKCYGHRFHELVKKCSFNSVSCDHKDFTYFNSIQYGNCFTFNKKLQHDQQPLEVHKIGPNSGLELDIDLDPESYLDITSTAGSRVVIHDSEEDPNPEEQGIDISPGYETQVSMDKTSLQRLPPPYKDRCTEYRSFDACETTPANQMDCIRSCVHRTSMSECGCVDPFLPVYKGTVLCNLKNGTQMTCLDKTFEGMKENGLPCVCTYPCTSTTYNLQLSTAILSYPTDLEDFDWTPEDPTWNYFTPFDCGIFKRSTDNLRSGPNRRNRVRRSTHESYAKLKVFYGSLKHTIYTQKPMFSESELYGQLGGNLSLWLGLSVVAMFEYAEKIFLIIHFYCANNLGRMNIYR